MTLPRRLPVALACLCLLSLTACSHDDDPPERVFATKGSTPVKVKTQTQTTQIPEDQAAADATPPPPERHSEPTTPVPTSSAPRTVDYPYAVPVQGKPGFVTSPYAPDAGYVDVKNMTPGQEARDPYTNKIFLVP